MKETNFLPLLKVDANLINEKVLVCGDPARAEKIACHLDQYREIGYNREYRLFNGLKDGRKITIASHGVGAAGAAVCFEELIRGGAEEIIRVGTAGSLQPEIKDGELVIATAAVREDGLTPQLISSTYPALSDYRLVSKLEKAGRQLDIKTHPGIVLTIAAFYPQLLDLPNNRFSKAGVLAVEMEVSALFVIASLWGIKAGAVLTIDGMAVDFDAESYNPHRGLVEQGIDQSIKLAIEAITSY